MNCPKCDEPAQADYVDIGVGEQRISPYYCDACCWCENDEHGYDRLLPDDNEEILF